MTASNLENKYHDMLMNLKDAGLSAKLRKPFLEGVQAGQVERSKNILISHRSKILTKLHASQNKLYCTDILLRQLRQK